MNVINEREPSDGTGSSSAGVWLIISIIYLFINLKVDPGNFSLNNVSSTLIPLVIISVLFIPFQAAFEEILFRGYLMQGFTVMLRNRLFPLVMTSVLFGLMHSPILRWMNSDSWQWCRSIFCSDLFSVLLRSLMTELNLPLAYMRQCFPCILVTNEASALQTPAVWVQHTIYPWIEFGGYASYGNVTVLILAGIFLNGRAWHSLPRLWSQRWKVLIRL